MPSAKDASDKILGQLRRFRAGEVRLDILASKVDVVLSGCSSDTPWLAPSREVWANIEIINSLILSGHPFDTKLEQGLDEQLSALESLVTAGG